MNMLLIIGEDLHEAALRHASSVPKQGATLASGALYTVLPEESSKWIERLWDQIEHALSTAWDQGKEAARHIVDDFHSELVAAGHEIGEHLQTVRAALRERLNTYLHDIIEGALARVQPEITIGGRQVAIKSVKIDQTVKLSGSLKASLEDICEFVAEGEMSLSAEYAIA